jgi:PAS domain S-box-containing protein
MGRGLSAYVLRTGEPLLLTDEARFEDLVRSGEVERMGAPSVSWLGVPLKTKGETLGILVAQSYEPGVVHSQRDMELLQFVSTQVAHAIEHKRAEEALRERERRFRALIENSADGIALLSERGRILFRSPSVHRILGYGLDANLGEMLQHIDPADVEAAKGFWKAALAKPAAPVPLAIRIRSNDGSIRPIEGILVNRLDDPAMRGVVLNFRDVSERKQAEARLMAADRMVSVGTLAAGVAHEINNPLAYVLANLALVADALPEGNDAGVRDAIAAARDGAERVRQIVRDLKTFSRAEETVLGPVNVHEVLDASANLAWNEIRHRARLERSYREDLPLAHANAARLGQVVLNLLLNAAQAMPDIHGGRENVIALRSAEADGQITIEVADNGSGIAPEHLPRLFDPFFTTKPLGIGTGLGLYVCQQLLSSMGGTITVDSAPGRGSTFRVLLPAARSLAPAPQPPSQPQPRERPHGRARILAVDDEPQIGRVIVHTLKAHDVTAPPTAEEALRLVRAGERFDLIICDLMMPGMTGMDLFAALERDFPDQAARMLFLTGGAFTPRARDFLETVAAPRMEKPFEVKALRARVAELLETFDNQR